MHGNPPCAPARGIKIRCVLHDDRGRHPRPAPCAAEAGRIGRGHVGEFYFSHLNHAGRGSREPCRRRAPSHHARGHGAAARDLSDLHRRGIGEDSSPAATMPTALPAALGAVVTPPRRGRAHQGPGCASRTATPAGVNVASIDSLGVRQFPGTMLGGTRCWATRQRAFLGEIRDDYQSSCCCQPLGSRVRHPRAGSEGAAAPASTWRSRGGRAVQRWSEFTGSPDGREDPACYLYDEEIPA